MTHSISHFSSVSQVEFWLRQRCAKNARLRSDSRLVQPGDILLAWPGVHFDARNHIAQALKQGALAVLCEAHGFIPQLLEEQLQDMPESVRDKIACLPNLARLSAVIADAWLQQPSAAFNVVAVTGTNGKTTVSWWLAHLMQCYQGDWGLIGTLGAGLLSGLKATGLTSPQALQLQQILADLRSVDARGCVMEASSIGLEQGRLDAINLNVAILTNLSQDHLDYHGTMAAYAKVKQALFDWPQLHSAVVNVQDEFGLKITQHLQATRPEVDLWGYSLEESGSKAGVEHNKSIGISPRLVASQPVFATQETFFTLTEMDATGKKVLNQVSVRSAAVGCFNLLNVLAVLAAMRALGVPLERAAALCAQLPEVPGRMQSCGGKQQPLVVVDYAHTPDALRAVLQALRPVAQRRKGSLVTVFGCGGDRDASKRPLMAQAVASHADAIWVTSDNPRSEDPTQIITQIVAGLSPEHLAVTQVEPNRRLAIHCAITSANETDVILVAGKGHEDYQEIRGQRQHFSDLQEVNQVLAQWQPEKQLKKELKTLNEQNNWMMNLAQAQSWLAGGISDLQCRISVFGLETEKICIQRVHTDSRSVQAGDLFVALSGDRFDGHDYLPQALQAGAVAAIVQHGRALSGLPCLEVTDVQQALVSLARQWRRQFHIPVLAVTGSNGKTTVTQMLAGVARAEHGANALATIGNLNNHIGVPLMVLRLRAQHRVAIFELGMNHPGEIVHLASIAQPTAVLINNAQREHLEFMQTIDAVAQENGSAIAALTQQGIAIFPADDAYAALWQEQAGERPSIRFGWDAGEVKVKQAAVNANGWDVQFEIASEAAATYLSMHLQVLGRHNVRNALAATAGSLALGFSQQSIAQGLAQFQAVVGRGVWRIVHHDDGTKQILIDDSYNANPDSVRALIDTLASLPSPSLLVLGDMGEVGEQGLILHEEVGAYAKMQGVDSLFTFGSLAVGSAKAFGISAKHFDDIDELQKTLREQSSYIASVAVKGSRFMRMERVADALWHDLYASESAKGVTP